MGRRKPRPFFSDSQPPRSYKINWQTVLYLGYGDDRLLTADNNLSKLDRSLFVKVSYAIQR